MLNSSADYRHLSLRAAALTVISVACLLVPLVVFRLAAQAPSAAREGVPKGWFLAGTKPAEYESTVDARALYDGHPSAYLRAKGPTTEGFGTLMQQFRADRYLGKRVRLSAFIRSKGVQKWAGLWMRVDKEQQMLAFDNMQSRPIRGTTSWGKYEVVLDVPSNATGIFFGILLEGQGTVWLNAAKFEVVGADIPTTGGALTVDRPTNLSFEE